MPGLPSINPCPQCSHEAAVKFEEAIDDLSIATTPGLRYYCECRNKSCRTRGINRLTATEAITFFNSLVKFSKGDPPSEPKACPNCGDHDTHRTYMGRQRTGSMTYEDTFAFECFACGLRAGASPREGNSPGSSTADECWDSLGVQVSRPAN